MLYRGIKKQPLSAAERVQDVGGGEEDVPFHFGNHQEPITEPPPSPSPVPSPEPLPFAGTSQVGYSTSGGGSDGVAYSGGGSSVGSGGTGGGQVLGIITTTPEELIRELRARIAMFQARLIELFRERIAELEAQLLALIVGQ
ncbi:MAG: hypothetical protein A2945_00510 [Candidatus Liptonbacteria bacterium RIFCSPLOWO2_01_FULL_52_25]|uniref:Uncharacterized protein n=1 Tax=Candidatus Liptonbacteria bacterium RIFCSPLOWO2_01_FULL_52_25 TaxID=1798650 RepID=A0A1G2CF14_9BACT|nr:MAG: hypothetical protein A2945_00510 [Candidatus Liptonbacteria bacterium RIFCSPLOWO2_01_FULL_52_25]